MEFGASLTPPATSYDDYREKAFAGLYPDLNLEYNFGSVECPGTLMIGFRTQDLPDALEYFRRNALRLAQAHDVEADDLALST